MKLFLASTVILFCSAASASQVTATYETTFDGGHSAFGTIIYDDARSQVVASGVGPTAGIDYLDIAFFSPTGVELFSAVNVENGISTYDFLTIRMRTATPEFVSSIPFDLGADGMLGDHYVHGIVGRSSSLTATGTVLDTASMTVFTITIPEPRVGHLLLCGAAAFWRRKNSWSN